MTGIIKTTIYAILNTPKLKVRFGFDESGWYSDVSDNKGRKGGCSLYSNPLKIIYDTYSIVFGYYWGVWHNKRLGVSKDTYNRLCNYQWWRKMRIKAWHIEAKHSYEIQNPKYILRMSRNSYYGYK
jgi:hypothetical protein